MAKNDKNMSHNNKYTQLCYLNLKQNVPMKCNNKMSSRLHCLCSLFGQIRTIYRRDVWQNVSLSYLQLTYANVIKSHLITHGITQLSTHCVHHPIGIRLHGQNHRVKVIQQRFSSEMTGMSKDSRPGPSCPPANVTSAATSGDLMSPLLHNRALLLCQPVWGNGYWQNM